MPAKHRLTKPGSNVQRSRKSHGDDRQKQPAGDPFKMRAKCHADKVGNAARAGELAAKYDSLTQVITGTTLGMMLANVPVVLLGKLGADRLPLKGIRIACAILFVGLGVSTLLFA
mgnify:CR=1 FL=1